ncbi:MAG TPA: class I SAM-dependent methyltransferase [Solirubrobacterales bacterium]|nr:class I SAM-dependent methyltransferase [Solirubrobacterales bacterium]
MEAIAEPGSEGAHGAYEAIAPVYDEFTSHHDYEMWMGNLLPQLERHGLSGNRLLDVGCGTGRSFVSMLDKGWEATACDISPSMLELARAKAGDRAQLSVADMRELPLFGEFDLVWSLDDAVNYMLDAGELESALSGLRANLAPDGLLMFDLNTLHTFRTFFAESEVTERGGRRYVWAGQTAADAPAHCIGEARLEVTEADGGAAIETHVHRQRHHPEADVLEILSTVGLECLEVFGHDHEAVLEQPVDELRHTKMVFIARHAQS